MCPPTARPCDRLCVDVLCSLCDIPAAEPESSPQRRASAAARLSGGRCCGIAAGGLVQEPMTMGTMGQSPTSQVVATLMSWMVITPLFRWCSPLFGGVHPMPTSQPAPRTPQITKRDIGVPVPPSYCAQRLRERGSKFCLLQLLVGPRFHFHKAQSPSPG